MSPACRASNGAIPPVWWRSHRQASHAGVLVQRNSPRLVAQSSASKSRRGPRTAQFPPRLLSVRSRLGAVWRPRRRPPRPHADNGVLRARRSRLRHNSAWPGVSLAREPLTMRVNPMTRTPISGYTHPHDETTTFNVDFPAPASRKVTQKPTRFVL